MRGAMKRWPWYAAVLAAYPLLHIAVTNPGQVEAGDVLPVVAAGVAAALALVAILRPVMGNWTAAGLGAAWVALLFYLYAPVNEWWIDWVRDGLEQQATVSTWYNAHPQLIHSIAWVLVALAGLARLRLAAARVSESVTGALNVVAALLVALIAIQAIAHAATGRAAPAEKAAAKGPHAAAVAAGPDIYYIVLDGYARADVLKQYYGFDNAPFLDHLKASGFQVSDSSRSNFNWTFLSVGSSLNLDYVQTLLQGRLDPQGSDRTEIYRLLRDNRAAHFLRERGYRTVALQSTWGGTASNPFADTFLPCQAGLFGNEYLRAVADASWLRALQSQASMDIASCHLQNFETLAAQAKVPGPKFVFAHFVPPHHPYLFDREGNILRRATISDQFEFQKRLWEDRQSYANQLSYVSRRIGSVVDRLIADSPRPPIILLISDHGPNLIRGLRGTEQRHVRMSNLTAMYLPGAPAQFLPADETPVNHLRRVFNFYFDAALPILPDRYFVSSYMRPYEFVEVDLDNEVLPAPPGS
jgi:Sulfatase